MAKLWQKNGVTSLILRVFIPDITSVIGAGKTGLTFGSVGLIIATIADNEAAATLYTQAAGNVENITTLGTFAAPTASKVRFKEVDATNFPGIYEIQIADARWAVSGARSLLVSLPGVSGLGTGYVRAEIQLTAVDPQNANNFGMAYLDAAVSTAGATAAAIWAYVNRSLTDKAGFSLATPPPTVPEIQTGLATSANQTIINNNVLSVAALVTTVINRVGALTGTGVNTIFGFLQAIMRSNATLPSDVGGTYDPTTDSLEAASSSGGLTAEEHAKVMALGSGTVTFLSVVNVRTGIPELVRGDDYTAATGRELSWLIEGFPTFTSMKFKLKRKSYAGLVLDIPMTITPEGSGQRVKVPITRTQTAALLVGDSVYTFDLEGVIAGGDVMTPMVNKKVAVLADTR